MLPRTQTPALCTHASTRPCSWTWSANPWTSSSRARSPTSRATSPPSAWRMGSPRSRLRACTSTRCPSANSTRAVARPMPSVAPVMPIAAMVVILPGRAARANGGRRLLTSSRRPCAVSLRGWRSEWARWWSTTWSTGPVDPCWYSTAPASTTARLRLASSRFSTALRGCGGSILTSLEWAGHVAPETLRSADDVLDTLLDFADEVIGGTAHLLIGHSAGAYYAQAMAARRPAQVAGLALVCPLLPDCATSQSTASSPDRVRSVTTSSGATS